MGSTRGYNTFEEFEREELRQNRNSAWSVDELVQDFSIQDELDLALLEMDREPPADDDDD